jgi:hypothetical protein
MYSQPIEGAWQNPNPAPCASSRIPYPRGNLALDCYSNGGDEAAITKKIFPDVFAKAETPSWLEK